MANVNRVLLLGNLGQDPELRETQGGHAVLTLSVATSRVFKDQDDHPRTETDWHRVVVWDEQAKICATHLRKGQSVLIEGRLHPREWVDRAGSKRQTVEVVARLVHFLGRGDGRRAEAEVSADSSSA